MKIIDKQKSDIVGISCWPTVVMFMFQIFSTNRSIHIYVDRISMSRVEGITKTNNS